MKQNNAILRNKYPIIAFVISLFMMGFFYVMNNIAPFGNQTILCSDLFHQYTPFLVELSDKIASGESFIYSIGNGLGSTFIGNFFNYACSPFNLIALLFGKENIQSSIAIIIALKVSLSAFTSSYIFKKLTNHNKLDVTLFGLLYTFSAFFISFYWNIMWYDAVYMLPILIYGIYKLIHNKKCGLYIFALAYTIITNYYMGYMFCITSVITFLYFYFSNHSIKHKENVIIKNTKDTENTTKEKSVFINRSALFAISSICAALISCIALLPIYSALQWSSATSDTIGAIALDFTPFEFFTSHFALTSTSWRTGSYFGTAMPNIYCGVLTLLMIPLYFLNKKINKREKIASGILIAGFYLSFALNILNFAWHGFHFPNDLPYRFSFIYCFFITFIALKSLINIEYLSKKKITITIIVLCLLITLLGILFAPNKTMLTIPFNIILVIIFGLIIGKIFKNKTSETKKPINVLSIIMCCILLIEIALPYMNSFITYKDDLLLIYQNDVNDAKEIISKQEDSFYRMELLKNRTLNDGTLYNYNGITSFSSMNYAHTSLLQKYFGISSNGLNSNEYKLQTPLYNMLFGLNYIVDNNDDYTVNDKYFTKIGETNNGYGVYESNFKTGIGFASISDLSDSNVLDYQTYSPFKNQSNFIESATGISELITHTNNFTYKANNMDISYDTKDNPNNKFEYKITGDRNKANVTITTQIEETGNYYAYIVSNNFDIIYSTPNNEEIAQICTTNYIYALDLGILKEGQSFDAKVYVSAKTGNEGSFNYFVCKTNDDAIVNAYDKIVENGILKVTNYTDSSITATINSKTDFVYTNIPYDTNWVITVDGKQISNDNISIVGGSLIGLKIEAGEHTITFNYKQPSTTIGLVISSCTLTILGLFYCIIFYKKRKLKNV